MIKDFDLLPRDKNDYNTRYLEQQDDCADHALIDHIRYICTVLYTYDSADARSRVSIDD